MARELVQWGINSRLKDCQIPFKLGLPSSVRATPAEEGDIPAGEGACPAIGTAASEIVRAATDVIATSPGDSTVRRL